MHTVTSKQQSKGKLSGKLWQNVAKERYGEMKPAAQRAESSAVMDLEVLLGPCEFTGELRTRWVFNE